MTLRGIVPAARGIRALAQAAVGLVAGFLLTGVASAVDLAQELGILQGRDAELTFNLEVGAEYDSNVSVNELDLTASDGAGASALDAGVAFSVEPWSGTALEADYGFSQLKYFELEDFDLQSHTASIGGVQEFGPVDLGVTYSYSLASLGGDDFLTLHRAGPYAQLQPSDRTLVRLVYVRSSRTIDVDPTRDADSDAIGADAYLLLDGAKRYLLVGYRHEQRDAVGAEFDYAEDTPRVRLVSDIIGRRARVTLGYRYETRAYDNVTPSLGELRNDDRHRVEAELEAPLTEVLKAVADVEFRDYRSNLASADYQEVVAGFRFASKF